MTLSSSPRFRFNFFLFDSATVFCQSLLVLFQKSGYWEKKNRPERYIFQETTAHQLIQGIRKQHNYNSNGNKRVVRMACLWQLTTIIRMSEDNCKPLDSHAEGKRSCRTITFQNQSGCPAELASTGLVQFHTSTHLIIAEWQRGWSKTIVWPWCKLCN